MNMSWLIIGTGFSIGLLGSLHCLGMCGPIALSLPVHQMPSTQKYLNVLLYNIGRAFTYAGMGALMGAFGTSLQLFGWQQKLSILAGVLMLVMGGIYLWRPQWLSTHRWSSFVSRSLGRQLQKDKSYLTFFGIGILNGLLPCGMVYMALVTAFATGSILGGSMVMFFFGLGTLPLMASLMISAQWVQPRFKNLFKKIMPTWVIVMAVLMILRGLNLGIPYVSPQLNADTQCVESCCHK